MEQYIVSARKYRPQTFEGVVGQKHITNTLENAIANNHLAQALLFCGPRGVGKTTCARILARRINESEQVGEEDFSLNVFELDAASNNSVDDIRRLIDQVRFAPQVGKFKVYIIDEVHMLSQAAFNAFLKTLEEPPAHAIFILATTEKHKIIPTILSRCQIFDFKRITVEDIAEHLAYVAKQEGIEADPEGLHIVAQKADGALRDALSIFDRLVSFTTDKITYQSVIQNLDILDYDYYFKATNLILDQNLTELLMLFNEVIDNGFEGIQFVNGLAGHFRDLLVSKDEITVTLLEVGPNVKQRYIDQARACSLHFLVPALGVLNSCDVRYKTASNQRLLVEVSLMELVNLLEKKNPESKSENQVRSKSVAKTPTAPSTKPAQKVSTASSEVSEPQQDELNKPKTADEQPSQTPKEEARAAQSNDAHAPFVEDAAAASQAKTLQVDEAQEKGTATSSEKPAWMKALGGKSGVRIKPSENPNNEAEQPEMNDAEQANGPAEIFSEKDFEDAWKAFLKSVANRKSIFALISSHKPQLKNLHEIHFALENKTQVSYIQNIQQEMLGFLREKLNNYKLAVITHLSDQQSEKRPYTAEERYMAMIKKNPNLDTLRKALDMDIE
jgi:DNA polymerase-3 subunit gamma/tau